MVNKLEPGVAKLPEKSLDFFRQRGDSNEISAKTTQYQELTLSTLTMCCTCDNN